MALRGYVYTAKMQSAFFPSLSLLCQACRKKTSYSPARCWGKGTDDQCFELCTGGATCVLVGYWCTVGVGLNYVLLGLLVYCWGYLCTVGVNYVLCTVGVGLNYVLLGLTVGLNHLLLGLIIYCWVGLNYVLLGLFVYCWA